MGKCCNPAIDVSIAGRRARTGIIMPRTVEPRGFVVVSSLVAHDSGADRSARLMTEWRLCDRLIQHQMVFPSKLLILLYNVLKPGRSGPTADLSG